MEENVKNLKRIFLKSTIIFFIIVFFIIILFLVYNAVFAQRVYLGVYVSNKHVGGMTYSELYNYISDKIKQFDLNGINYKYDNFVYNIKPNSEEIGDSGYRLIYFEPDKTSKLAYSFGRESNSFKNFLNKFLILIYPKKIQLNYDFNKEKWQEILREKFKQFETDFVYPKVGFSGDDIVISKPQDGKFFDYEKIIRITDKKISNLDTSDVNLEIEISKCPVSIDEANAQKELINQIINLGEISLKFEDKSWNIKSDIYKNWLLVKQEDKKIVIGFDFDDYKKYLEENISREINIEVQDAKFSMKGGKVNEFIGSRDGREVDVEKTLKILKAI